MVCVHFSAILPTKPFHGPRVRHNPLPPFSHNLTPKINPDVTIAGVTPHPLSTLKIHLKSVHTSLEIQYKRRGEKDIHCNSTQLGNIL
jgi:hypothetical protein